MKTSFFPLAVMLVISTAALAAPHTPPKGSAERTALMNSTRRVLGSGKHKAIITPYQLNVEKGWAFLSGTFTYEGGAPLEEQYTEGSGTNFSALLHHEGKSWRVKRRLYHGDVVTPEFIRDFPQAPRAIFK